MKNRYLLGAGAALALALGCTEANAQTWSMFGWQYPVAFYIGPEGGWTQLTNQDTTITTPGFTATSISNTGVNQGTAGPFNSFGFKAKFDSGYNVGARAGIQWGPMRLEEEYSYRRSGGSTFDGSNLFEGSRRTNALMTNFIYDFTVGWPVSPHLGFGIGAVNFNDSVSLTPYFSGPGTLVINSAGCPAVGCRIPQGTPIGSTLLDGNTWQFGYQAIAGIRYDINPLLAFDVDYRYLSTTTPTINNKGQFPFPGVGFPPGATSYKSGYNTHNIVASLT
jgi:opacity protein-like surface antigen